MKMWHALLIILALLCSISSARADAIVTLCNADNENGAGTNLVSAMAIGGRVSFACGAPATILMNCRIGVATDTEIEGGSKVTLQNNVASLNDPPGCGGPVVFDALFQNRGSQVSFKLTGVRLVGANRPSPGGLVMGNFKLTVSGSTISGWNAPILVFSGEVAVDNSTISNNSGVSVDAPRITILNHSSIANNAGAPLEAEGGAVLIADSDFTGNKSGSKLFRCSSIDIRNTRFDSNSTADSGGALNVGCDTRISSSSFTRNQARTGGALYIGDSASHTVLTSVTFEGNTASADGGAIALRGEIFPPIPPPQSVELHGVVFKANQAQFAAGLAFARMALPGVVLSRRTLSASTTQFIDNHASIIGGGMVLARAEATFDRVTFVGNKADQAGGGAVVLEVNDGRLTLANSLIAKNTSPLGAAIAGNAFTLINSTVADNNGPALSSAATVPPFPQLGGPAGPQPIRLRNTVIAGGTGLPCGPPDAAAPYVDLGHNLQHGDAGCGASIAVGAPQFGPSYIPMPTGPAAHGGDDAVCAAQPIAGRDLWDNVRPYSGHCAIGAAEPNLQQTVNQAGGSVIDLVGQMLRCLCLRP